MDRMQDVVLLIVFGNVERRHFTQHELQREWIKCTWRQRDVRTITPTYASLIGVTQVAGYHFIDQRVDLSLSPLLISLQDLLLTTPRQDPLSPSCQLNRTQVGIHGFVELMFDFEYGVDVFSCSSG